MTDSRPITAPKWLDDEVEMRLEIEKLEELLNKQPSNVPNLCRIIELHTAAGRPAKAKPFLEHAISVITNTLMDPTKGVSGSDTVVEAILNVWKASKYLKKKSGEVDIRLDISGKRRTSLQDAQDILDAVVARKKKQTTSLQLAYVSEMLGNHTKALAILSDLISDDGMSTALDLSYVIFKAAILLKHVGQNKQAIEYMEFLTDDPPTNNGFSKTHVLAFLILLYESSEEKYKVFVPSAYNELFDCYRKDLSESKNAQKSLSLNKTQYTEKKLEALHKSITTSSDIWEILALQAIDRCEYIMAIQLIFGALTKNSNKPKLHHLLSELLFLVDEKKLAIQHAELAMQMNPENADIRNFLLQINPDKHADALRVAPATQKHEDDGDGYGSPDEKKGGKNAQKLRSQVQARRDEASPEKSSNSYLVKAINKVMAIATPTPRDVDPTLEMKKRMKKRRKKRMPGKNLEVAEEAVETTNPYRPARPPLPKGAKNVLRLALHGNQTVYFYDETLQFLADMRKAT